MSAFLAPRTPVATAVGLRSPSVGRSSPCTRPLTLDTRTVTNAHFCVSRCFYGGLCRCALLLFCFVAVGVALPLCQGKTLESLSLLAYLKQYRDYAGPHLIIVPKSTSSNWLREVGRWTNNLSVHRFHGNAEEREAMKPKVAQHDITITTYEMVILEKGFFAKQKWKYIYIDEAHRIKVRKRTRSVNRQRLSLVRLAQPPHSRLSAHVRAHVACLTA